MAVIAKATASDCEKALETENNRSKGVEALAADSTLPKGLVAALRQVLVSTAEVPFTDGYRRALRHEGHNLNIVHGSLKVFATGNYADTYSSITRMLAEGSVEQPVEECDDPTMPSLQAMHRLVASSPRAQAKFFLLMNDIVDVHLLGMDGCSVGRLGRANYKHREDELASSGIPGLAGFGAAELEPFEAQDRGFQHGHRKVYGVPGTPLSELLRDCRHTNPDALLAFMQAYKAALKACAETVQYETAALPAEQMGQSVLPEKFTMKQQVMSRLDGGAEIDGSIREHIQVTADEPRAHVAREQERASAESRPTCHTFSQLPLTGCQMSMQPNYRLPHFVENIVPVDPYGASSANSAPSSMASGTSSVAQPGFSQR